MRARRWRTKVTHCFALTVLAAAIAACGHAVSGEGESARRAITNDPASEGVSPTTRDAAAPAESAPPAPLPRDAAAASTCAGNAALTVGDHTVTITSGGRVRSAFVHVPKAASGGRALPLVIDFHPLHVDAATWKLATGWSDLAEKEGFVLVVPQGIGNSWNAGRCCGDAHDGAIDDVAFVRDLVARVSSEACIDPKRVHATGCSNGGGMSYRVACDAADVIATVAPVDFDCITGPTNAPSCAQCAPSRPISVVQFRGTADSLVPYGGGPTSVVAGFEFPGAKANFADWGARNACSATAETVASRPLCERYPSCADGAETELCTLPLGVHCGSYLPFGIAKVAWEVMKAHPLP